MPEFHQTTVIYCQTMFYMSDTYDEDMFYCVGMCMNLFKYGLVIVIGCHESSYYIMNMGECYMHAHIQIDRLYSNLRCWRISTFS